MNALTLLAIAVAILALGYRYFARFLATATLMQHRPTGDSHYSTMQPAGTAGGIPGGAYLILIARGGIPLALVGASLLVLWGWTPGFLWILTSGALFAGAYTMTLARGNTTVPGGLVYGLGLVTNAFSLFVLAALLVLFPAVASAYVLELALFAALARWGTSLSSPMATALAGFGMVLACVLGMEYPLAILGHLRIDSGIGSIGIGATALWAALIMAELRSGAVWRAPWLERAAAPQFLIAAAMAAVALVIRHPALTAPAFRPGTGHPHALPASVLAFTGLPFSALYWYWACEETSESTRTQTGTYGLSAVLTIAALTTFLAVASSRAMTFAGFSALPFSPRPQALAALYDFISRLRGPGSSADLFLATLTGTATGLALRTALGFGLMRQRQAGTQLHPETERFGDVAVLLPLAVTSLALAAAPLESWMLFGAATLLFAGRVLWTSGRAHMGPVAWLGAAVIALADWALIARVILYWHERRAMGAAIALTLLLGQAWAWRQRPA
ncbi:MAG: hypothetical protein ACYCRH_02385 [Acidiferrobacteraceae bacterium]